MTFIAQTLNKKGIDIVNLELVINDDLPDVAETYVHGIGRTGRAGNRGTAFTFCSQDEHLIVRNIQRLTGKTMNSTLIQD